MKRTTIAKDFEAKQANPGGALDHTITNEAPLAATAGASDADWSGKSIATDQFASKDELGELRQAVAMKVSMGCAMCSRKYFKHAVSSRSRENVNLAIPGPFSLRYSTVPTFLFESATV